MRRQGSRFLTAALLSGTMLVLGACEARDPGQVDGTTPTGAMTDPVAERGVLTLTGCLQRGERVGQYVLASVGTAGVIGTTGEAADGRSWTVEPGETDRAQGRVAAATSYQLVTMGEGEDLEQYQGQRVAVRGRLAPEAPADAGVREELPEEGQVIVSTDDQAIVQGSAPPLRAFYYESVNRVAETCEP